MHFYLVLISLVGLLVSLADKGQVENSAIVYIYTMIPDICNNTATDRWNTFPSYIEHVLNQALFTQQHAQPEKEGEIVLKSALPVIFISNYKTCTQIKSRIIDKVEEFVQKMRSKSYHLDALEIVDTSELESSRTTQFFASAENIFMASHGSLWIAAAARFFWLEDLMRVRGLTDLVHLEGDNLLYAPLAPLWPALRKHYPGLAVTPMDANKSGLTASFFWVPSMATLVDFTDYMLELSRANTTYVAYLGWLRRYACCMKGSGIAEDASGKGIKPFKVNEMTALAYYRASRRGAQPLFLLPIVPTYPYHTNRYTCNMSFYAPNAEMTGSSLYVLNDSSVPLQPSAIAGKGVLKGLAKADAYGSLFDPGSWGQYLGGTHKKSGRDKRYADSSHIVGQAISVNNCVATMQCGCVPGLHFRHYKTWNQTSVAKHIIQGFAAPFVRCGKSTDLEQTALHPLIQLHVHSKKVEEFVSFNSPCDCEL